MKTINNDIALSRRSFLKGGLATLLVAPFIVSCNRSSSNNKTSIKKCPGIFLDNEKRMLGSGKYAMEVSSIGFGCMG